MEVLVLALLFPGGRVTIPDPDLPAIQEEIASHDLPGGYYAAVYRRQERLYWSRIPAWMREDAGQRRAALQRPGMGELIRRSLQQIFLNLTAPPGVYLAGFTEFRRI